MLCTCSNQFKFDERGGISKAELRLETSSRELSAKLKEGEVQLRQGSIHDAEVSLREALSINNEVPLLLGRVLLVICHLEGIYKFLRRQTKGTWFKFSVCLASLKVFVLAFLLDSSHALLHVQEDDA